MKYRLKKDLPFAKVGEVIDMGICGTFENIHLRPNKTGECSEDNLKMMLQDGWIEEIKPREWWVTEHKDDPVGVVNRLSISEEKPDGCPVTKCEIFKVTKVIDEKD